MAKALADAAFAFFAANQPMAVEDIAADGYSRRFSMAAASTPDWFAAAATKSSSLIDVAPELRGIAIEEPATSGAVGPDLIHMYDPDAKTPEADESGSDKDIQWHLLKGIADLPD
jgi:hypothetical protein